MPDITMCNDKLCPMQDTCYRFQAEPNERSQAYFAEIVRENARCMYYWPMPDDAD